MEAAQPQPKAIKNPSAVTVYKISSDVDARIYVGCTMKPIWARLTGHAAANTKLGRSIREHGRERFKIEPLEVVAYENASEREAFWIRKLSAVQSGFNTLSRGAIATVATRSARSKSMSGRKKSLAHRQAISEGVRRQWANPESRSRMMAGMKSANRTEEGRARQAESGRRSKGRKHSPEARARMRAAQAERATARRRGSGDVRG